MVSRNMVILGEPGISSPLCLLGGIMILSKSLYLMLTGYVMVLCCFIPFWVFFVLGWQILSNNRLCSATNESNSLEFFWTVIPTTAVAYLCFVNLQCLVEDSVTGVCKRVKIVGRQ